MPTFKYTVNGKRVPSVTTILSRFKDPGALMYWSWNLAYEPLQEAVHLLEEVNKTLLEHDLSKRATANKLQDFLKGKPLEKSDYKKEASRAATAGTIAHNLVEQWVHQNRAKKFTLPSVSKICSTKRVPKETAKQARTALLSFLDWTEQTHAKITGTELALVSPTHLYGGCIDAVAKINGKLCLFDWKTSGGLYVDYILQLAAYSQLYEENHPKNKLNSHHLIRFDKEFGDFHHHQFTDLDTAKKMFLLFRKAYEIGERACP
jgi:ATP-dependent exoDNAse (exonuclease V) beta subunit